MDITIQSLHFTANDELQNFIREKVAKLERLQPKALFADVVLSLDHASNRENKISEIKLSIPGHEYVAKRGNSSFETATVMAIEAIENQLSKKEKKHHADRIDEMESE